MRWRAPLTGTAHAQVSRELPRGGGGLARLTGPQNSLFW